MSAHSTARARPLTPFLSLPPPPRFGVLALGARGTGSAWALRRGERRWLCRGSLVASSAARFRCPSVLGPRETGLAGEAPLVRGKPKPVNSRSSWHFVEATR